MGTYTDTYVEMLQQDLQHHYRRLFEVGNDLVQALRASEGKDLEISTMKNFLDSSEVALSDALRTVSARDIEIERLTFALKDKDKELESVRDEHRTQIDELMEEIERLTRKNKKRIKVAELRWLIDGHTDVLEEHRTAILWLYVQSIAAHINTGGSQENP